MKRFLLMMVAVTFAINISVTAQAMPSPEEIAKKQGYEKWHRQI